MQTLHTISFKAMGSPCELKLYCHDQQQADGITRLVLKEIDRFEKKYSRFKPDSITSTINAAAGQRQKIEIDEETAKLLQYADTLYQQSDRLFDITSGVLRQAWNFKSKQLPNADLITSLLPKIGWQNVLWDERHIQLPIVGMEIDFGGFVKEYAADVVAVLCQDNGITNGLINLGGDIRVIGPHLDQSPWRVGIQHPRQQGEAITRIDILRGGLATSGDYERYMVIDGVRYSHLLNPLTGKSIQPTFSSVSVIADNCLLAGSFSTMAMLKSHKNAEWLSEYGISYLTVDHSMCVKVND